jgi:hypothetical protein
MGILLILLSVAVSWMHCSKSSTGPKLSKGSLQGAVKTTGTEPLYPAYLIAGDSLLATTDQQGRYSVASIPSGPLALTCSALNYGDTTMQVQIVENQASTVDFILSRDETKGLVFGEFQDQTLFTQSLKNDPTMQQWSQKDQFDGATGATMCYKILQTDVGDRSVFLKDSLIAVSDAWGQYWFKIPHGVYPLKGVCDGYQDKVRIVKVLPTPPDTTYANFFLTKTTAKAGR